MAINFPNNPSTGNTYDFNGVRYTYQADGYWAVTTPGTVGVASGAEVITGTDNAKYVTPKAMEDSDYWNARNQGPGSGLDADTLDGTQLSSILRKDSGGVITVGHRIEAAAPNVLFHETDQALDQKRWWLGVDGSQFAIQTRADNNDWISTAFQLNRSGVLKLAGSPVWTSGNDGPGSGLNADTLDGIESIDFSLVDTYKGFNTNGRHDKFSGDLNTISSNSTYNFLNTDVTNEPSGIGAWGFINTKVHTSGIPYRTQVCYTMNSGEGKVYMRSLVNDVWNLWVSIGQTTKAEVDALNIDADTVDGAHLSALVQKNVASVSTAIHKLSNDAPRITYYETDAVAGSKSWSCGVNGGIFRVDTRDDVDAYIDNVLSVDRGGELKAGGDVVWDQGNCPKDLVANGYQKLASGLIIQWGFTSGLVGTTRTITFPIAFPGICRSVQIQSTLASSNYVHTVNSKTASSFIMQNYGITADYYWMAIGY